MVRRIHGILIMFHHNQGIAHITQLFQGRQQLVIVPLMQSDGRLIQNIQHAHQRRTNLCCQTDALALTAGKCGGSPGQCQIAQSHILQKAKSGPNLFQNAVRNQHLLMRQLQLVKKCQLTIYRHFTEFHDVQPAYRDRQ